MMFYLFLYKCDNNYKYLDYEKESLQIYSINKKSIFNNHKMHVLCLSKNIKTSLINFTYFLISNNCFKK